MLGKRRYKCLAVVMAFMMAFSLTACRFGGEQTETATEEIMADDYSYDFAAEGVKLPEDFGNMIYPVRAVMTQLYSTGCGYYGTEGNEDPGLFWFTMAELVSLMNAYVADLAEDPTQAYAFLEDEKAAIYATALYNSIGTGDMEMPELADTELFAVFDEEREQYGFLISDEEGFSVIITEARTEGQDLVLKGVLSDADSGKPYGEYLVTLTPSSWEGEENDFAYSVKSIETMKSYGDEETDDTTEVSNPETEDTESFDPDETLTNGTDLSQDQALALAKDIYGDAEYQYVGTETLGEYVYYDFLNPDETAAFSHVLVSMSGADVIAGNKNDDGSWTLAE